MTDQIGLLDTATVILLGRISDATSLPADARILVAVPHPGRGAVPAGPA